MAFSKNQKEYFNNAKSRWNIKTGATRSGKTYMDYFTIPKRIRNTKGNGLIVILGNTQSTIERNILDPMREIWGSDLVGDIRSNNNKVRLFGKDCYAIGADKKNAVTKIQGAGIEYCYGDEITTWSEEVFEMLKSRLDKENSVFDGTCNPDNPNHWFKKFLDSDADIYYQHYTIDDNPFLSPYFVEQLKKEYSGSVYYQRYILGLWARAEGLIYDMYSEEKHLTDTTDMKFEKYYVAIDYGTQNATTFGLFGLCDGLWYLAKEYYHSGRETNRQKTDEQYADDLEMFIADKTISGIIVDPSAASFKVALRKRGLGVINARNSVLDGIRNSQSALSNKKIFIDKNCKHIQDEFITYSWDTKASEKGEDKPLEENDHCLDMFRYFINTVMVSSARTKNYSGRGQR